MSVRGRRRGRRLIRLGAALCVFGVVAGVATAAPGDLDPSFGDRGTVVTPNPGDDLVNGLKIQPDGKLVVGGSAHGGTTEDFSVSRYTKHGRELDATFGGDGDVVTVVSAVGNDHIFDLALAPDGKIVAAGFARMGAGAGGMNFAVARYLSDGTLDTSFGGDGVVTTPVAPGDNDDFIQSVALQPDGKIVVGGGANMGAGAGGVQWAVARYEEYGDLDPTFGGGDGIFTAGLRSGDGPDAINPNSLVVLADGRILAAGLGDAGAGAGGRNFALLRLLPSGDLDATFGSGGKVSTPMSTGDLADVIVGVVVRPDGSIAASGIVRTPACCDFGLALYTADGAVTNTILTGFGAGRPDLPFDLVLQSDGKLVVGGQSVSPSFDESRFALARYNPNGTLDDSFGSGGLVTTPIGSGNNAVLFGLEQAKTGKLVAAGECVMDATGIDVCLARYKAAPQD